MTRNAPSLVIGATTAAAGTVLLVRTRQVARLASGGSGAAPPVWIVRVLGARYLTQAAAELARPSRAVWLAVSAVDSIHAVSMLAAATVKPAYRRAALANAAVAAGSAAVTAACSRRR